MLYAADALPRLRALELSMTEGHEVTELTELLSALLAKTIGVQRSSFVFGSKPDDPISAPLLYMPCPMPLTVRRANLTLAYCIHKIRHTGLEGLKA